MDINLAGRSASEVYAHVVQLIVPRPIAWVLSDHEDGRFNLAPYSYFNAISGDPPLIMLSIGKKPDGKHKDTRVNIERRRDFVIHIPHRELLDAVNESSATLPASISEVEQLGMKVIPFAGSRLPRLEICRVALACVCYDIIEIGAAQQAVIFGRLDSIYIDDGLISLAPGGRIKVDAAKLNPLARLGANEYAALGEIIPRKRPE
jgi:flavin reductase (DIM6/NTAB) family NADH-FMN oxidoreductase RutF